MIMIETKSIFSDNALFQAKASLTVKGRCEPLADVSASIVKGGEICSKDSSKANADGLFEVALSTPDASFYEYEITVSAEKNGKKETKVIKNVLFGELWLSSGQSNMEMQNHYMNARDDMYEALSKRKIRIYLQDWMGPLGMGPEEFAKAMTTCKFGVSGWMNEFAADPEMPYEPVYDIRGVWLTCTLDEILKTERASAIGTSMILDIYNRLNETSDKDIPVGFVNASVGGTDGVGWLPRQYAEASPEYMRLLHEHGKTYDKACWNDNSYASFNQPSGLYNLKIAPLEGVRFAGIIWYQGENNIHNDHPYEYYREIMRVYFTAYRDIFGADERFTMIASQINPFLYEEGKCGVYHISRAISDVAAEHPDNFSTVTNYDLKTVWQQGWNHPLHPSHKYDLGKRFANAALRMRYGFPGIRSAAIATSYEFRDGAAFVTFDRSGEKLDLRSSCGFRVADGRGVYYDAKAELAGDDTVKLTNEHVAQPTKCVFNCCDIDNYKSLYRGDLPVTPFSSEDYDPAVETRTWLFTGLECQNVTSFTFGDPDFYKRPTWRPEGISELCRDDAFASGDVALRLRGENGSCGAFISSYPCARLDLNRFTSLRFEISYPRQLKCSIELVCGGKNGSEYSLTRDARVYKRVAVKRDILSVDFRLPEDADEFTVKRMYLRFENVDANYPMCTVSVEKFDLV